MDEERSDAKKSHPLRPSSDFSWVDPLGKEIALRGKQYA
jgi:hypothetical protein